MKYFGVAIATLAISIACAPTVDPDVDSEAGSGTDDGGTDEAGSGTEESGETTGPPAACEYVGQVYEHGAQFDSPDGCVTYVCGDGVPEVFESRVEAVPGDLSLSTQAQVDELVCLGSVGGTLSISDGVASVTPLTNLRSVGLDLSIVNTQATTLTGLEQLTEVGGSITIADNGALTQMGFTPYLSVFGDVTIQNNDALPSLAGAAFIGQCGFCLEGAPRPSAGGDADEEPGNLEDGGAEPPDPTGSAEGGDTGEAGGTFYGKILIADNDVLTDISALGGLYYAWDDVRFRDNASLASLATMQLTEVQGDLEVSGHVALATQEANDFATTVDVWGTTLVCGNQGGPDCV